MPLNDTRRILIVDRDVAAVEPLRQKLCEARFTVRAITDGAAAVAEVIEQPPRLVIIDWNMPGYSALEVIQGVRKVRGPHAMRLIILSALAGEQDIVMGLNLGADDYIAKPFSPREVVARVTAVLRLNRAELHAPSLVCGELVVEASSNRVLLHGRAVNLRSVEYRLLQFLMSHAGRTFNRMQLLNQVWGDDSEVDERTVDVNIQRLRKLLNESGYDSCIQTVRGFGYRFAAPAGVRLS